MRTSKYLFIFLSVVITLASCNKKDMDPEPEPVTTPTPTPVVSFNGWARAYNEYSYYIGQAGDSYALSFARIFFTANSLTTTAAGTSYTYTYGGMVTVNNVDTLQYAQGTYEKNLVAAQYTTPVQWKVAGAGTVSQFTSDCSIAFPGFTGFNSFPTSISKNAGVTFTISGFTNTDRMLVGLSDGNGQYLYQHEAIISGNKATVNFPASETANFTNGNLGYIEIYFYHDEVKTANNFSLKYSNVRREFISGFNIVN